jgi:hypothetical protein
MCSLGSVALFPTVAVVWVLSVHWETLPPLGLYHLCKKRQGLGVGLC